MALLKSTESSLTVHNEPLYRDTERWKIRFPDSVSTTNNTVTAIALIDELVDDSIHEIMISVAALKNAQNKYGVYRRTLSVLVDGGVVTIKDVNSDYNDNDGLSAADLTFAVVGGNIEIRGKGNVGETFVWETTVTYNQITTNAA